MSIRTNPMKAVPVLLKRVESARRKFMARGRDESFDSKLEKLMMELKRIEDVFMKVKKNQDALLDNLHEVDGLVRRLEKKRLDQDMDVICKRIRDSSNKLLPMDSFDDITSQILNSSHPSSTQPNNQVILPPPPHYYLDPDSLSIQEKTLLYLSIFPEHAVIRRRQAISLWIGLGLLERGLLGSGLLERVLLERGLLDTGLLERVLLERGLLERGFSERRGESIINELLELNAIVPYGNGKSPVVNKFILNPHIRPRLEFLWSRENVDRLGFYLLPGDRDRLLRRTSLVLQQQKVTLGDEVQSIDAVYNISASYLNFGSKWMDKLESLVVLQLGRWQDSASHHIEVGSQEFLKDLSNLKNLKYLSLRGISRIFELPPSIARLEFLRILDLKACHNLETLPDDISPLKSLTHLNLSQCYLLDGMPKGIEKLTKLQVLKGFVIGDSRMTPCTIFDLANLKELRRLSIHIAREALIRDMEFESLRDMSALEHLKISWGVSDIRYSQIPISLPSSLEKLHLQGFRGQTIPEWLKPSELPRGLKELNITGGKLASMNHGQDMLHWSVEIVRLRYLKDLEIDLTNLQMLFPMLKYALIKPVPYHSYIEWSKYRN